LRPLHACRFHLQYTECRRQTALSCTARRVTNKARQDNTSTHATDSNNRFWIHLKGSLNN
jgi:hypothetical protein